MFDALRDVVSDINTLVQVWTPFVMRDNRATNFATLLRRACVAHR